MKLLMVGITFMILSSCTLKYNNFYCSPSENEFSDCVINLDIVEHEDDHKPKLRKK